MKRIVIGAVLASLVVSQAVGPVEAKSKAKKKPVVQVDRDKNGIPDAWQKQYHLGYGKQVATKDHDRDGLMNVQEYQLRLNPLNRIRTATESRMGKRIRTATYLRINKNTQRI